MFECANVEMRELLPELAAGTLDAPTRARVEAHIATCAECASELETLRLVRRAFASAPAIDTRRIVAALPKPPVVAPSRPPHVASRRRMGWRVAAVLAVVTIGGLSVVVSQRQSGEEDGRTPAKAQLSFGGGVSDLDRASLEALMGALDEIEREPVAPSVEPGRLTVMSIIGEDTQ